MTAALELPVLCTVDDAAASLALHADQIRRLARLKGLGLSRKRLETRRLREKEQPGRKKIAGPLTARIIGRIKGESAAHRAPHERTPAMTTTKSEITSAKAIVDGSTWQVWATTKDGAEYQVYGFGEDWITGSGVDLDPATPEDVAVVAKAFGDPRVAAIKAARAAAIARNPARGALAAAYADALVNELPLPRRASL